MSIASEMIFPIINIGLSLPSRIGVSIAGAFSPKGWNGQFSLESKPMQG